MVTVLRKAIALPAPSPWASSGLPRHGVFPGYPTPVAVAAGAWGKHPMADRLPVRAGLPDQPPRCARLTPAAAKPASRIPPRNPRSSPVTLAGLVWPLPPPRNASSTNASRGENASRCASTVGCGQTSTAPTCALSTRQGWPTAARKSWTPSIAGIIALQGSRPGNGKRSAGEFPAGFCWRSPAPSFRQTRCLREMRPPPPQPTGPIVTPASADR